jgi:hypothetical protein
LHGSIGVGISAGSAKQLTNGSPIKPDLQEQLAI